MPQVLPDDMATVLDSEFFHRQGDVTTIATRDCYGRNNSAGLQLREDGWLSPAVHWDGLTALPAGWAYAGAPFAAPTATIYNPSVIGIQAAANSRHFLYKAADLSDPYLINPAFVWLAVGVFAGVRWDDGTDNNYVELVIDQTILVPTTFRYLTRWRVGGGVPGTLAGATFSSPVPLVLRLNAGGTKWTNWSLSTLAQGCAGVPYLQYFWQASGAVAGLTWTPSRAGIVFDNTVSAAAWHQFYCDAWIG